MNRDVLRGLPRRGDRPFFVFINYMDAHIPYVPPQPFFGMFRSGKGGVPPAAERASDVFRSRDSYDGSIAYLDDQVGRLLDELRRRGQMENTLVIVTADHGELFGEHGLVGHGNSLYMPLLHVPLVVSFPGRVPRGRTVPGSVSLADLPATVMDLTGPGGAPTFPCGSLSRTWGDRGSSPGAGPSPILSEVSKGVRTPANEPVSRGPLKSLVLGEYHYILNGDGQEEIYDWQADPSEEHDLAGSERGRGILGDLRAAMREAVGR